MIKNLNTGKSVGRKRTEYNKSLKKLRKKLSRRNYYFFTDYHRHGDYVLDVSLDNKGDIYFQKESKEFHLQKRVKPINVVINILCPTGYYRVLKYTNVRKYVFDFPSANPLWFNSGDDLGSWGYDELSLSKNGYFRYEILLHSGASILIEFEGFSYSSKKLLTDR